MNVHKNARLTPLGREVLVSRLERGEHPQDVGTAMGGGPLGVSVTDDPLEAFANAQAVIDFTAPGINVHRHPEPGSSP